LDESAVGEARGALREIGRGKGAVARLTSLPPGSNLDDHVHDHPYLSLHVLGAYSEAARAARSGSTAPPRPSTPRARPTPTASGAGA
jgi:hypothetical protein